VKIWALGMTLIMLGAALFAVGGAHGVGGSVSVPNTSHSWTQIMPTTLPTRRDQVQMAYDPAMNETILFGGYDPIGRADADTWAYAGGVWTDLTSSLLVSPAGRWGAGFAYDPQLHGIVLFGGRNVGTFFNTTWVFNNTGWHQIMTTTQPTPRAGVAMAWDPLDGYLLLYGGDIGNLPGGSGSRFSFYNGYFELSGTAWVKLGDSPMGSRSGTHLVYDPVDGYMMFSGGSLGANGIGIAKNDTWSFVGGVWTKLNATGGVPTMSEGGCLTWDSADGFAVLFGEASGAVKTTLTWTYSSGVWTNLTGSLSAAPPPRGNCGLVFDAADNYVFLFAGDTPVPNYNYYHDNWEFV
jgi:hypothetical protein